MGLPNHARAQFGFDPAYDHRVVLDERFQRHFAQADEMLLKPGDERRVVQDVIHRLIQPAAARIDQDAVLLVLIRPQANVGQLLFELRRNREHIAALV